MGVYAFLNVVREIMCPVIDHGPLWFDAPDNALASPTKSLLDGLVVGFQTIADDSMHLPNDTRLCPSEKLLCRSPITLSGDEARKDAARVVADSPPIRFDLFDPHVLLIRKENDILFWTVHHLFFRESKGKLLRPLANRFW